MVSAFLLCVSFEVMGLCEGFGGKLYSRRLTPCGRGLMAPPGLTALGAKGAACDRLRLTGGLRAFALGSYIVSLRWRGMAPLGAPFFMPPLAAKTGQPGFARRKTIQPPWRVSEMHSPFGGRRHHLSPSSRGHYGYLAMGPCLCRKA